MFETPFVVVGNIVNDPVRRRVGEQDVIKFRVASNSRRRTPEGEWEAGNSLFVNVNCWGRLVGGVAPLIKGDPVIVVGHLYTSEYDDREGNRRTSVEVRATAVGPDLTRSIVSIDQPKRSETPVDAVTAGHDADAATDAEDEIEDEGLPLTA